MRMHVLILAVSLSGIAPVAAQVPSADTVVVPWSQLSAWPQLRETGRRNAGIRFPDMLGSAHVGGEVRLELTVDPDGRVDLPRTAIRSSTHDMFASAVRRAIVDWRFSPALAGGRAVRAHVPVTAVFVTADDTVPTREIAGFVTDSSGLHFTLGRQEVPIEPGVVTERGALVSSAVAVLSELIVAARSNPGARCVAKTDGVEPTLSAAIASGVRASHPEVLRADRCPRTYASMILQLDARGRPVLPPAGAVDPVWLSVNHVRPWASDHYVMEGFVAQGTGTDHYFCDAHRERDSGVWRGACKLLGSWVS
jgi:TonB family protein